MKSGSLAVVGTGYQVAARITAEAAKEIENAETVFYLVYDWLDEVWLRRIQPRAISLFDSFKVGQTAAECCEAMTGTILSAVRQRKAVCAAFSGHPSICINPTHNALQAARKEGFDVRMIPGISALDCLFADLCLDPAAVSCRVFDATRFLLRKRPLDLAAGLVLLQVSQIGRVVHRRKDVAHRRGLKALRDALIRDYGPSHKAIHYQTSLSPFESSTIEEIPLSRLLKCDIRFKSTLYVPPQERSSMDAPRIRESG